MTHDPLCPLTPPTADYEPYLAEAVRAIQQETPCQCDLIAKVRADTRRAIVDGLKAALPESDTRDSAVTIATFATS